MIGEFESSAELADRHFRLGAIEVSTYIELQTQYLEASEALLEQRNDAYGHLLEIELLLGRSLGERNPQ